MIKYNFNEKRKETFKAIALTSSAAALCAFIIASPTKVGGENEIEDFYITVLKEKMKEERLKSANSVTYAKVTNLQIDNLLSLNTANKNEIEEAVKKAEKINKVEDVLQTKIESLNFKLMMEYMNSNTDERDITNDLVKKVCMQDAETNQECLEIAENEIKQKSRIKYTLKPR